VQTRLIAIIPLCRQPRLCKYGVSVINYGEHLPSARGGQYAFNQGGMNNSVDTLPLITAVKPLAPTPPGGGEQQRSPFALGQLLMGTVSAKGEANQFTLDINGRLLTAESSAPLQVGQRLDLQVASLSPQIALRVITHPANRLIANAIHLAGRQDTTFPSLIALGEKIDLLPQLSLESRQTLQLYANSIFSRPPEVQSLPGQAPLSTPLTTPILEKILIAFSSPANARSEPLFNEISGLLTQLARSPALPSALAGQAVTLATVFAQAGGSQPTVAPSAMPREAVLPPAVPAGEIPALLARIGTAQPQDSQLHNLLTRLLPLLQTNQPLPALPAFRQLIALLAAIPGERIPALPPLAASGQHLREIVDRLGINMEQLFAHGDRQQAVQTLKFALMELAQRLPATDPGVGQADQITRTIELYQLLQIRLAGEALFFLPLPFSFLEQGFLLVDGDRSGDQGEKSSEQAGKSIELHLRLQGLGNLRIAIQLGASGVALDFMAEDAQRAKFLADHREEVHQWLTATNVASIRFLVGSGEPVATLLEKIIHGSTGMVDTSA